MDAAHADPPDAAPIPPAAMPPDGAGRGEHLLVRWVFLRGMGLVYLSAFASLGVQVRGLIGEHGILPATAYLHGARMVLGSDAYAALPTLAWLGSGDGALAAMCWGGAAAAVLVLAGVATAPALAVCWVLYLSLSTVGQDFLGFQWDALLLESGFLAVLFAPGTLRPGIRRESPPSPVVLWLVRVLLFRLMFFSGAAKLASGDPTWRGLSALAYHYHTQPLPTPLGWLADQAPLWLHAISAAAMLAIELAAPFLVFAGRRARAAAFAPLVALQLLILATGNFGFFNLLAIVLCVPLLDDAALRRLVPSRWRPRLARVHEPRAPRRLRPHVTGAAAALVVFLTVAQLGGGWAPQGLVPAPARRLQARLDPVHLVNGYGLFAVMTTRRMEIEVQGSDDGHTWRTYPFRYKPGDPRRAPAWIDPHMPRLDWQMWFAALGPPQQSPWLGELFVRLLEGRPEVTGLFAANPFPRRAPRQVRAIAWEYRFATVAEHRATGAWWVRTPLGEYTPAFSLAPDGQGLQSVDPAAPPAPP